MKNLNNDNEFVWERNKFLNRKYLMEEMYQNYQSGDKDWDVEKVWTKNAAILADQNSSK